MTSGWTTVSDIRAAVRRRWDDESLLRAYAAGAPFPRIERPLRGPRASAIGDDVEAVRAWIAALEAGARDGVRGGPGGRARYELVYTPVGGRHFGRNQIPSRAEVTTYAQAWALLGVRSEVGVLDDIRAMVAPEATLHAWVCSHPLRAIGLREEWPRLVSAYRWLDDHRGSGRYLREIAAPGVDTKFAERHRSVLAQLLGVPAASGPFLAALGLRAKPELSRLRTAPGAGPVSSLTEVAVRRDELPAMDLSVRTAVIIENEITYLSVPVPTGGVVLWGKGFEVGHASSLPWLREADVHYWGDLDTHGFAILNLLRAGLPQTRSFLMDRDTLLAHRDRWVHEDAPTSARLDRLGSDEARLYADLVGDRYADAVRLEQERIDWTWVEDRLPYS